MDIIVAGCGKIGNSIIANLIKEGHNITAIDNNAEQLSAVTNIYDVMGICGNGADLDILKEAGIDKSRLFVAVTGSDELNMLACYIARKLGARHTIARIRNPEYNDQSLGFIKNQLNLSISINPEALTARELFNILKFPSAIKVENFGRRSFEMVEILLKSNSHLDNVQISELNNKYNSKVLVCAVERNGQTYIPDGNFVMQSGDRVGIVAKPDEMQKFFKPLGLFKKQARNVMILGGSRIAYYLAKLLIEDGCSVKIIEKDREVCHNLCDVLPKADIINGDGTASELLLEEGVNSVDAFVSLTGIDETNVLMSLYASSIGVPKVITKINRPELAKIAANLGLESIISPQNITSNIFVRYARAVENSLGSKVETLYKIMNDNAEVLEFNVSEDFKQVNIPLKELSFKSNIIVAGIIRGRKTIIPNGDDVILDGDKVIVCATDHRLRDLSDIIK